MFWHARFLALVILTIVASTFRPPAALAVGAFDLGVRAYNSAKFRTAIKHLTQASTQSPYDARIRYYRANALVKLGRHKEALYEYKVSWSLDPYGDCAPYCLAALRAYGDVTAGAPLVTVASAPIDTSAVDRAMMKIGSQAGAARRRLLDAGQSEADHQQRLGEIQAQRVGNNAAAEIASIRPSVLVGVGFKQPFLNGKPLPVRPFLFKTVGFTPAQLAHADFIRQQAASAQVSARHSAQVQAQRAARIAAEKARSLDETAANLQSQMLQASLPGSAALNPVGTSLYVRNYGP